MNQEKINFHVVRDFSELFNAATKFLSQNFKHFFKILLFIAGPFILISSIFGAFYQSHALHAMKATNLKDGSFNAYSTLLNQFGWEYFIFLFSSFVSGIVLLTTVYAYIIVYNLQGPKNFEVEDIKAMVLTNIWKTIKGFFILFLILVGIMAAVGIIATIFISMLSVFGAVLMVVAFLALLIISPPFFWQFSAFYIPLMTGDNGVADALQKVRVIMKGEFFSTWLLVIASILILAILAMIFSVPQFIYQIVLQLGNVNTDENTLPFMIVSAFCTFCSTFIYSIFYVICAFHYYSLSEKTEGTALINRIDEIGNIPSADVDEHY